MLSPQQTALKRPRQGNWLKRAGLGGLIFFTVKGLAWVGVLLAMYLGFEF